MDIGKQSRGYIKHKPLTEAHFRIITRTGKMEFENCPDCNIKFSRRDAMLRHRKNKHGINQPYPLSTDAHSPRSQPYPPPPPPPQPPQQQQKDKVILSHPFTMMLAGPTGSGKTFWMKQLLERSATMINPSPKRIIWCYKRWQPMFDEMKQTIRNILFVQGIPEDLNDDSFIDSRFPSLIIFDDLMNDATNSQNVCELFVEGSHHRNLSVACLVQNAFYKAKGSRTMSINSQYLVLFKNPRDQTGPAVFARQMYPQNTKMFMKKYSEATKSAYGYLFIDLKQNTSDDQRLKSNIFDGLYESVNVRETPLKGLLPVSMVGGGMNEEYKRESSGEAAHSDKNAQGVNMDKQNPSCIDCGTLFSTEFDVQRHIKRGCPMQDDEPSAKRMKFNEDNEDDNQSVTSNDTEVESIWDDMDDSAFNPLINDVYEQLNDDYQIKINEIMENQGVNEEDAKEEANELFLPRERRLLIKDYKQLLLRLYALKQSPLHRQITGEISNLMDKKSYSYEKAILVVLRKNTYVFDEHLSQDSDGKSENDSDDDDTESTESDFED